MRALLALTMIPLVGCSSLLGIENPSPDTRHDAGVDGVDAVDAPSVDHLMFDVGDFQLSMQQSARVHVTFVHSDGTRDDVTATATYSSDNETIVKTGQGVIFSADTQTGSATITASQTGAASATVKVTVNATMCHPVINELATGSAVHGATDEWIEIYNPCTVMFDVTGWTLKYRGPNTVTGSDDSLLVTLPGTVRPGPLLAGDLRLYAGAGYPGSSDGTWASTPGIGLGQMGGAVGLRDMTATRIDSVGYDTASPANPFTETTAVPGLVYGSSAARRPFDGNDTGDGASDFVVSTAETPGAPNAP